MTQDRKRPELSKAQAETAKAWVPILSVILIAVLGSVAYGNSLNGKFVWDDQFLVKENIYIKNWSTLSKVFHEDIAAGAGRKNNFYRPVQMLSYMIDYSLWGLDERGYHLTNLILHLLVAIGVWWMATMLFGDRILAFFAGSLFVVHPIQVEAVSYISGRADPLSALFMLLTLIFYIRHLDSKNTGALVFMSGFYVLALLSRENSLILPFLILLYHYAFRRRLARVSFLVLAGIAFAYILIRITVLRTLLPAASTALFQRIPGFFVAIATYAKLLLLPFDLHMEYGSKLFLVTDHKALAGALILALLLICAFMKRGDRVLFFSVSWFLLALLPNSNLYPINAYMAEHWLYLPSIGFFLIIAKGLSALRKNRGAQVVGAALAVALISFYSYLTIRQNAYWEAARTFYERTLRYAPDSARVCNNLGLIYRELGRTEEAVALYKKAMEIDPKFAEAYNDLGLAYVDIGRYEDAVALFKKAIEIEPTFAEAYNDLGLAYGALGKYEEAAREIKRAIEIKPAYAEAYSNLGSMYYDRGDKEEAMRLFKKAIGLNPYLADVYNNLGLTYSAFGKPQEAIASYEKAVELNPTYADAHNNLGLVYLQIGKREEAIAHFKKAIESDGHYAHAYNNLGGAYYDMGRKEEAIASYKRAIEINPRFADALNNLAILYFYEQRYDMAIECYDKATALGFANQSLSEALKPHRKR
jgi:type IV pilus biogenesis/stability protein PilW